MDRRAFTRFELWLPVKVAEVPAGMAVCHNVSLAGALMVVAASVPVGEELTIDFRIPPDSSECFRVAARVTRCEPNSEDPEGLWPYRLAVAFYEPQHELQASLEKADCPASSHPPERRAS